MVTTGQSPYPIERTLLTTGVLDAAMQSRWKGHVPLDTPYLDVSYQTVETVPETGIGQPLPPRTPNP
jgi:hypothetical protein